MVKKVKNAKPKNMPRPKKLGLGRLVSIVLIGLMLKYLIDLEKESCECALTENRKNLKILLIMWLVVVVLNIVTNAMPLILLQMVIFICIIYVFFKYENELKVKCECSDATIKNIFKYFIYFKLVLIVLMVLLLLAML